MGFLAVRGTKRSESLRIHEYFNNAKAKILPSKSGSDYSRLLRGIRRNMLELNRFETCCFSGYRPHKFSFPLKRNNDKFIELENNITNAILDAYEKGYRNFLCGGAMGFDLVCGEVVVLLKEKFPDIKLIMVLPYKNQPKRFLPDWRQRYDFVLSSADHTYYFSERYNKNAFVARNAKMVAHSSMIITYYNGKPGGTANTIAMAQRDRLHIVNIHEDSKKPYEKLSYYIGGKK